MQEKRSNPLVQLSQACFSLGGRSILSDISWRLERAQHWGVLGANGAGKSTFLRLVRGEIWPRSNHGSRTYCVNGHPEESPLAFRRASALVSSELLDRYQKRQWNLSALETVCTGLTETVYLHEDPGPQMLRAAERALSLMGLAGLEQTPLLKLSRGQIKRVLIARALVRQPEVLILDEACEDLDAQTRAGLLELFASLANHGVTLLYATHRREELLPELEHVLVLENGRIVKQGPRDQMEQVRLSMAEACAPKEHQPNVTMASNNAASLIQIHNADVFRERQHVLHGINWTIRPGQSWALLGPNGAGKTTLLMLLSGDLLPALGGGVEWFGQSMRPSLWELRQRIGLVSGDLQARHQRTSQTGLDTVVSGFQGSIDLNDQPRSFEIESARQWMESLGVAHFAERNIAELSYGELRRLLITRAMVTEPELLLLDEPLAGLDAQAKRGVLELIERLIQLGVGLVLVTHHAEDLPPWLTHVAELDQGRLVFKGAKADYFNGLWSK
jgi:molybdate transport system ATP-binding protein